MNEVLDCDLIPWIDDPFEDEIQWQTFNRIVDNPNYLSSYSLQDDLNMLMLSAERRIEICLSVQVK